jgi:hypothetical protein
VKTKTFEVKGIRWDVITTQDGKNRAVPTCPDHPKQEAKVAGLNLRAVGVLVWCPQCGSELEIYSAEEFETDKKKAEAS